MSLHSLHEELVLHCPFHCGCCRNVFAKEKLSPLLNSPVELLPQVREILKSKREVQELLRMRVRRQGSRCRCFDEPIRLLKGIHHSNNAASCFSCGSFGCTWGLSVTNESKHNIACLLGARWMASSLRAAHSRDKANSLKSDDSILVLAAFLFMNKASNL